MLEIIPETLRQCRLLIGISLAIGVVPCHLILLAHPKVQVNAVNQDGHSALMLSIFFYNFCHSKVAESARMHRDNAGNSVIMLYAFQGHD
jgi:hypothetical protein